MKKTILLLVILLLIQGISATTVKLEADKEEFNINETIELHLEIDIEKPIGGRLEVYQEIEPNRFAAEVLYTKASPAQCSECTGSTPLNESLSRTFYFTSEHAGYYYAEANFDGVRKRVNFTVASLTYTSTSSITTMSTYTSTLTTTTLQATTSIISVGEEESILDGLFRFLHSIILLFRF
ncbi:MAG: hypothetical protein L6243_00630 [Candidatus Altiarchaeales archaeon]|nr:hypothetical protein [Candidatus Altiarchaeota archaeon]MBU4341030.1 hypothetical protein [Candidatus Altiarchaeota archaeon]MBU4406951.1 hypothetical protein [Candidatus Altiarchaeota archaeon]MBU4437790.1 hypothetical protein [Candidatus Altiarchaeota archaeon]MCG2782074.1 hypothetical protein [Candidatus Altiarchaeales archaeon]